jgi:integrase
VWRLRADAPPDPLTGQRRRVTKTVYVNGKRQAQQELAKLLTELGVRPKRGGTRAKTVADACTAWLTVFDALVAAGKKSPASGLRFREVIESYVDPTIGEVSLRDLTTEHINALYLQLLTNDKPQRAVEARKHGRINPPRPLAAATVQKTHVALSRALDHAINLDWLDTNPAIKAVRPQPDTEDRTITAPNPEDVQALLGRAKSEDPEWYCYLRVASSVGNRRGEAAALRWSAVNMTRGTVTLGSVVSVGKAGLVVRERAKTKRGVRQVSIDPVTLELLRVHHTRQVERALTCGTRVVADPFVFSADVRGAMPIDPRNMTRRFYRLRNRMELNVRLHDLRHHVATQLLAAGVDVVTVAGRLGQDPAVTLRTYSHFVPARDKAAAEIMGGLLDGAAMKPRPAQPVSRRRRPTPRAMA